MALARVVSEREMRRAEGEGKSFSVALPGGRARRWPDLAVELDDGRRVAVEVELAAKRSRRLRAILLGYEQSDAYDAVRFVLERAALARRLVRLASEPDRVVRKLELQALPGAPEREAIERAAGELGERWDLDVNETGQRRAVQLLLGE